jgi:hypothetical protein
MFLMLGCGISIGLAINASPLLSKQQTSTVRALSAKLDGMLQESDRDHALLKQQEDAMSQIVPALVAGKLSGRRVAIIRTGDYDSAVTEASDAVTAAGAQVVSTITLTGRLQLLDTSQRSAMMQEMNVTGDPGTDAGLAALLHPVTAVLRVGDGARSDLQADIGTLTQEGIINTSGDLSMPVSEVIVVGGSSSGDPNPPEVALLTDLTETGSPGALSVVGCETSDAEASSMSNFTNAGISTVDCIDLPIGALDLPYALRDRETVADYGVKSTSTRLVPTEFDASNSSPAQQTGVPGR